MTDQWEHVPDEDSAINEQRNDLLERQQLDHEYRTSKLQQSTKLALMTLIGFFISVASDIICNYLAIKLDHSITQSYLVSIVPMISIMIGVKTTKE